MKVNPRYTSQCCPVCGHTEKANRNKRYICLPVRTVVTSRTMTVSAQ
ncbi:MAG: zinc ribbon domain-containing protein [Dysosmobacter sp.]